MRTYLRLIALIKPYRRTLLLAFGCSILYALFNAIAIWFSASFITAIFSPEATGQIPGGAGDLNEQMKALAWQIIGAGDQFDIVKRAVVIFFLAFFLRNFFDIAQVYFIAFIEQRVIKDLRDKLYGNLLSQSLSFFHKRKSGELASVLLNDVALLNEKLMNAVKFALRDPFVILVFLVLLFTISWRLTLAALLIVPVAGYFIDILGRSLKRKSIRMQEALSQVTELSHERLGGVRLIKVMGTEASEQNLFEKVTDLFFRRTLRQRRLDILNVPLTEVLGLGIIAMILLYGGYLVFVSKTINAEDFIRFIAILFSILAPAKAAGAAYNSAQIASAAGDRIFQLLDTDERLPVAALPISVKTLDKSIRFEDVSFRYNGAERDALEEVNLEIQRGETIALVGPSGAGKTTMLGLLIRLFDPTQGSIKLDDSDLRELDTVDLRRLFGVVSQDIVLFNDSVAANIAYGAEDSDMGKVQRAAQLAHADEFIQVLPHGYDTSIGDRGTMLSGGQQQRLSIARALLLNPAIIIFDEATSQLDSESEAAIQQAMEGLRKDHTLILIAHRLATVRRADRIVVLDQGRIIDVGSYDELYQRCDLFNRLCQGQFLA
ncbi:MAG: ABC transporter ATP-binding protein [bacterium]|nr:ABC transporter ATP-binding protein [bacterium]